MKKDQLGLRIAEEKKKAVEDRAVVEGKTVSQIASEALDIYLSIPPRFLKQIQIDADELKRPVGIVIAYLFAAYTAMTSAMVNEDIKTPIFDYAFRVHEGKLMELNEMGKLTFREVQGKIRELKDLAEKAKRSKKRVVIDDTIKGIMVYAL
jgi:hypothetical protein